MNLIEPVWWNVQCKRWFPTSEWSEHYKWWIHWKMAPIVSAIRDPICRFLDFVVGL